MKTYAALLGATLFLGTAAHAEPVVPRRTFGAIASEYSGERAQEAIREIVRYHRIQGSPMMASVAERVRDRLKEAGLDATLEQLPSDGKTLYGTWISPMGWEMKGGELRVEKAAGEGFTPYRVCRYEDAPMCVSSYSKGGTFTGELVDVGRGTSDRDYDGKDVKGKVVLASGYAGDVIRKAAVKRGAIGAVIVPAEDDRPEHPDMIRYNGVWPRWNELATTAASFMVSANQAGRLRALMAKGPVVVKGTVDAAYVPGKLTLVHASIRGTDEPQREVLVTAHLDHPKWSANDNASGSAALLEMARTLKTLIDRGTLPPPRRTLHFVWVPELFGTLAWASTHPEVRRCEPGPAACVVANLNLDMMGEDTVKTASRFYATRAPASVPSFLDALLEDLLDETRHASLHAPTGTRNFWPAETIPYAQGSDHDVFLGLGIPASMLGHDPDWTHHTTEDTVDKTDASELLRTGTLASAGAYWMASAGADDWARLAPRVAAVRLGLDAARLATAQGEAAAELGKRVEREAAVLLTPRERNASKRAGRAPAAPSAFRTPESLAPAPELLSRPPAAASAAGARRLTLLPIAASALEDLPEADARWWAEQEARFAGPPSEGLAIGAPWDVVHFEAVNLMNGRRTPSEIALHLQAGLGVDIDAATVERLASVLAARGLVAR